jgi:ribosomal protein S12 methylthiotransferase
MRRPGNRRTYDALLARIRRQLPGVTLRTTFIVGFPGETDADFAELDAFVAGTGFDHVGVFTYSHEEGTRAYALADDVPAGVKQERRDALMARQRRIVSAAQTARIGTEVELMVDGPSAEHELVLQGRTAGQAPDIDAVVYLTDCDPGAYQPGELIRARVVDARAYDLICAPVVAVTLP